MSARNPTHPAAGLRGRPASGELERQRVRRPSGRQPKHGLAPAARAVRHIARCGLGLGEHWLEQRRFLDAPAG